MRCKYSFLKRFNGSNNIFYSNTKPWSFKYDDDSDRHHVNRNDLSNSLSDQIKLIRSDESYLYKYVNNNMFKIPKSYLTSVMKNVNVGNYPIIPYYTGDLFHYYKPFSSFHDFMCYCKLKGIFSGKTTNQLVREYSSVRWLMLFFVFFFKLVFYRCFVYLWFVWCIICSIIFVKIDRNMF